MAWVCGVLSFMWFCPDVGLMSNAEFEGHLNFFSQLDIVLSVPEKVCPSLSGERKLDFQGIAHLMHDERLETVTKIESEAFSAKVTTCSNDCTCGALLTLEDKVVGLTNTLSKTLRERQEQLTSEYFESCQEKTQMDCETPLVKEALRKMEI